MGREERDGDLGSCLRPERGLREVLRVGAQRVLPIPLLPIYLSSYPFSSDLLDLSFTTYYLILFILVFYLASHRQFSFLYEYLNEEELVKRGKAILGVNFKSLLWFG